MTYRFHTVRKFSGIKFLPPGFHFIAWSPPPSSTTAGPSVIPIRQAFVRNFSAKERYAVHYDKDTENISLPENDTVISDDNLKTLDKELAPYPFERFEAWKSLTSHITPTILQSVIGPDGKVDGLMPVIDQEEDTLTRDMREKLEEIKRRSQNFGFTKSLMFVRFSLKKSWRDGAVGEEVTVYSKDKSWLLGNVIDEQLDRSECGVTFAHINRASINVLFRSNCTFGPSSAVIHSFPPNLVILFTFGVSKDTGAFVSIFILPYFAIYLPLPT